MNKKAFKVSFKQENNFSMPLIKAKIDGRDFILDLIQAPGLIVFLYKELINGMVG